TRCSASCATCRPSRSTSRSISTSPARLTARPRSVDNTPTPRCEETSMLTELNHFLLVAKDLERTKDFYCRVLGMEVAAERPDFGFPGYWLKTNGHICVHLASQDPNRIRDTFLLKKHPKGTTGSGAVDHIAFLAQHAEQVRNRIQKNKV